MLEDHHTLWVKINLYLLGGIFHFQGSEYGTPVRSVRHIFLLIFLGGIKK